MPGAKRPEELPGIEFHCNTVDVMNQHVAMSIREGGILDLGILSPLLGLIISRTMGGW